MPWCVAVDCGNNTFTKNRDKDVIFYNLPKDINLRKKWITNIKRENIPKNPKIWHQHFEGSCFKRDLKVNMVPLLFTNLFILYINKSIFISLDNHGRIFSEIV